MSSPENSPQPGGSNSPKHYTVGDMEDALGRNFYELENSLGAADATGRIMDEIESGLARGDDAILWELAGMPERRRKSDLEEQEMHGDTVRSMFNELPVERQLEIMERVHRFVQAKSPDWHA